MDDLRRPDDHTFEQVNWERADHETRVGVLQEMVRILLDRLAAAESQREALRAALSGLLSTWDDPAMRAMPVEPFMRELSERLGAARAALKEQPR